MQKVLSGVVVLAIAGGVFYFRTQADKATDELVENTMTVVMEEISKLPSFSQDADFYQLHVDHAHGIAINEAYTPGRRRRAASFDAGVYAQKFCEVLSKRAQAAGKQKVDQDIRALQIRLEQSL